MMTAMLFRLLSIAAPTAALPALLAGFLAATAGISLIASAAWIIASAALAPPLSALALFITCVRHRARRLSLSGAPALPPSRLRLLRNAAAGDLPPLCRRHSHA